MSEQMTLGDILGDDKPAAAPAPEPAAPATSEPVKEAAPEKPERTISRKQAHQDIEQAAQGRVRDPTTGQYAAKEKEAEPAKETVKAEEPAKEPAKPVAAPQQEFTEKEKGLLRAAMEERNRRQAVEKQLSELQAKAPKEPEKAFWDDPEGAMKRQADEMRQQAITIKFQTAELIARQRHPDFDEKIVEFKKFVEQNPSVVPHWMASPDPAEFAYKLGTNQLELQQAGGMDALKVKIEKDTEARVRTKIEAELKEKAEALAKERAALPPSLSEARSTGSSSRPMWSGPPSLDNILGKE